MAQPMHCHLNWSKTLVSRLCTSIEATYVPLLCCTPWHILRTLISNGTCMKTFVDFLQCTDEKLFLFGHCSLVAKIFVGGTRCAPGEAEPSPAHLASRSRLRQCNCASSRKSCCSRSNDIHRHVWLSCQSSAVNKIVKLQEVLNPINSSWILSNLSCESCFSSDIAR